MSPTQLLFGYLVLIAIHVVLIYVDMRLTMIKRALDKWLLDVKMYSAVPWLMEKKMPLRDHQDYQLQTFLKHIPPIHKMVLSFKKLTPENWFPPDVCRELFGTDNELYQKTRKEVENFKG